MTSGAADAEGKAMAKAAVVENLTPICVEQYLQDPNKAELLEILKDKSKSDLSLAGRETLEKKLAKKKAVIAKIAKKILPKIRSAENERLAKKRGNE